MENLLNIYDLWVGQCPLLGEALYVWAQGCPRRCHGCVNTNALDLHKQAQLLSPEQIADRCFEAQGNLVLSGGEPFEQSQGLLEVCKRIRLKRPQTLILIYTGYTMEELLDKQKESWLDLLKEVDVLIDGPFIQELLDDDPLIGSSNQRIFVLSNRISLERVKKARHPQIQLDVSNPERVRVVGTGRKGLSMTELFNHAKQYGVILE